MPYLQEPTADRWDGIPEDQRHDHHELVEKIAKEQAHSVSADGFRYERGRQLPHTKVFTQAIPDGGFAVRFIEFSAEEYGGQECMCIRTCVEDGRVTRQLSEVYIPKVAWDFIRTMTPEPDPDGQGAHVAHRAQDIDHLTQVFREFHGWNRG